MFRFRSITHKFIFISLIILTFISAFIYAGFRFTQHMKGEATAINLAGELRFRSFEMAWLSHNIISRPETREFSIRELKEEIETFDRIISYFKNGNRDLNIKPITHLKDSVEIFNNLSEEWNNELKPSLLNIAELREDTMAESFRRYDSRVHDYVYEKVNRFVKSLEIHYEKEIREFDTFRLYALGLSLLIAIFIVVFVKKGIVMPVKKLKNTVSEIEKGNFDVKVELKTEDEIGGLGKSFNNMSEALSIAFEKANQYAKELLSLADASNVILAAATTTTIYETICDIAVRNFGLKMAWLGLIEEPTLHPHLLRGKLKGGVPIGKGEYREVRPVAQAGFEEGYLSSVKITWDDSPIGMSIKTGKTQVMNDIPNNPQFAPWRDEAMKRGYRSSIAVPLISTEGRVMGALNLYSSESQFFTKDRVRIFNVFANLSATAIENRMLIEGFEERIKEKTEKLHEANIELEKFGLRLHMLYQLSFAMTANPKEFARLILREIAEMLDVDVAAVGSISGDEWVAYAVSDRKNWGITEEIRFPINEVFCRIVHKTKRPLIINDASMSKEFKNHPDFVKHGTRSYLGVPVFIEREPFGILCTFSRSPHQYSEYDLILHQLLSKRLEFEFIKERHEAELIDALTRAESASKAKSDFLANISHELRTPLNSIIGFSELMLQGIAGTMTDQQKEYIADIYDSGKHLLSLIDDILDLSKVEAGKMTLEPNEFSLRDLINASLVMFKEKGLKHNIKAKVDIENGAEYIIADERKIKQVIVNLLSNAFKFTPDGGRVSVLARRVRSSELKMPPLSLQGEDPSSFIARDEVPKQSHFFGVDSEISKDEIATPSARNDSLGEYIEISVEDTGIGISEEDMPRLFQPFQQLGNTLSKKYPGTGLGLSLSKKIIELHGGTIRVESEVGKGSRFTFVIPMKGGGNREV